MQFTIVGIALIFFAIGLFFELIIFISHIGWKHKRVLAVTSLLISTFSVGMLVVSTYTAATVLISLIMVYRAVNLLRLVEPRMHEQYLRHATERSFVWLVSGQTIAMLLWLVFLVLPSSISGRDILFGIGVSIAIGGLIALVTAVKSILATSGVAGKPMSDQELPTVTIAIAARNENSALQSCLESTLASDYPKLEIIVLDDCSQDHTADVIKSFAHDGVRFVQGSEPSNTWLAKNAAYQKLLEESTGELIFYMGVDVRLHPQTVRRLVELYSSKGVQMMSILPKRTRSGLVAAFIQPMRYWWELALPKFVIKHRPVLSTSWIANRKALIKEGGFKSVTRAIVPEEHLSNAFSQNGGYAFVRTNEDINLTTHKDFKSQWLTAVRTRYPQVHRRPELAAIRVLIMLYFLIAPFVLLPLFIASNAQPAIIALTAVGVVALIASHLLVMLVTNPIAAWVAVINFPILVTVDFIALHISMYRYEFGEVIWKGRNVTTPAMHVIPHLPKLDD